MGWRSITLTALAIGLGVAAGLCLATETRLLAAIMAGYSAGSDSGPTPAQSATQASLSAQFSVIYQLAGPLLAGSLLCVVALLVVLAWRWQGRRIPAQN